MTSINDIADLARILKEQPEWADTIRSLLLSEELLNLPARFAEFVQLTQESNRITNERLGRLETVVGQLATRTGNLETVVGQLATRTGNLETVVGQLATRTGNLETVVGQLLTRTESLETVVGQLLTRTESLETVVGQLLTRTGNLETVVGQLATQMQRMETRMGRLEGRFSNFEGSDYERRVKTRALVRARDILGIENPYLALTQDGTIAPQLNSAIAQAIGKGAISREQSSDLYESDLIISDDSNRHSVVEVSLTADEDDVNRAKRRAGILRAATGGTVMPVVITAVLSDAQSAQAAAEEVTTFVIPYP